MRSNAKLHNHLMFKIRAVILAFFGLIILVGLVFFAVGLLKPKVAGIYIETNPASTVFINSEQEGRTPFRVTRSPGEVTLKLIPDSFQVPLSTYETRVLLVEGVETVVRWDFGEFDQASEGETISFEKTGSGETSLVIVSIPDSAEVSIDGFQKAFTPYKTSSVSVGDHTLTLRAQGFKERSFRVKIHQGYKLTALVKLSEDKKQSGEANVLPEADKREDVGVGEKKDVIEILTTPTGFLRVRSEPSTLATEVGKVSPGETFELLEEDEKTGWYKIEYEEGGEGGWISNQYAKKVEGKAALTPTPSVKSSQTPKSSLIPTSKA